MPSYRLTRQAKLHLAEIKAYTLANHGHNRCVDYLAQLRTSMLYLAEMPEIGRARSKLTDDSNLRSFASQKHIIFYTINQNDSSISVIAILHRSMDIPTYFGR